MNGYAQNTNPVRQASASMGEVSQGRSTAETKAPQHVPIVRDLV